MATQTLQPGCVPANPIVAAYLAARASDDQIDQSDGPNDSFEARMAQFTAAGAREYAMAWGINDPEHGALVALLTADRLQNLIDGYSLTNDRRQKVVTFGIEELYEVRQIKDALLNLWRHLDPCPRRHLQPLATDLGLIDKNGNSVD
jgi:hypothetical protein